MSNVTLVVGLGFGDEGKGSICDFLVRAHQAHTVVRFNGGAQAAHNVVDPDGRHHTFAQFGSGTFVPGCRTHLSRFMLVNPIFLMREETHLRSLGVEDAYARMTVERAALVTTPFQVAANRLKEMIRAYGRHGSCGMGIGETMADHAAHPEDTIRISDIENTVELRRKLGAAQGRAHDKFCHLHTGSMTPAMWREWDILTDTKVVDSTIERFQTFARLVRFVDESYLQGLLAGPESLVFEGAQGVLLDQDYGFFPFCTRTDTTLGNAKRLLEKFDAKVTKLGVLRAYSTRHGAGPFPTEDPSMDLPDTHNGNGPWQQAFRVGPLDFVLTHYALRAVGGVDEIVMTNVDRVRSLGSWKVCTGYDGVADGVDLVDDYMGGNNPFFHVHNGMIEDFKVEPGQDPASLARRTEFTTQLAKVQPDYEYFSDLNEMIGWVARDLRTPINLCSFGPTAADKKPRC